MTDVIPDDERATDGSMFTVGGTSSLSEMVEHQQLRENSPAVSVDGPDASQHDRQKYTVDREIARGGMGAILEARDNDLRRTIAMKVMHSGARATNAENERFIKEAQVAGVLEHPNIVPVHELGVTMMKRADGATNHR